MPPSPARTLGPVADFERHLPADRQRSLVNAIDLKPDGDIAEKAAEVDAEALA